MSLIQRVAMLLDEDGPMTASAVLKSTPANLHNAVLAILWCRPEFCFRDGKWSLKGDTRR